MNNKINRNYWRFNVLNFITVYYNIIQQISMLRIKLWAAETSRI